MRVSVPALAIPAVAGGLSAWLVSVSYWEGIRPAVLPALSVMAAAVLVRLARGLVFTNADHFTLAEFQAISQRLIKIAGKLRSLIVVQLVSMALLIFAPSVVSFLAKAAGRLPIVPLLPDVIDRACSALIGLSVVYSFVRVFEVVQIDVGLLKLQTRTLEAAIAKKNEKAFDKEIKERPPGQIAGATEFGRVLQ